MNENEFWRIVEFLNWPVLCHKPQGYKEARSNFLKKIPTVEEMLAFKEIFVQKQTVLYKALSEWERDGQCWHTGHNPRAFELGDDSFGDLIVHIIGMGREHYNVVLQDPERGYERARAQDFIESFSYCIPYEGDYISSKANKPQAQIAQQEKLVAQLSRELQELQERLYTEKNKLKKLQR